jgi:cardiolipin synthase
LAGEVIPEGEDRLLTVPNVITLVRLLCIPVFVWMLFGEDLRWQAAFLMAGLGATDWVDGYVARRYGQVSNFGKMFDPTVDRLLMITGVGSIIIIGAVPLWFGLLVIAREVVMSAYVAVITFMGARRMDVTFIGKTGTFCQMVAFPLFLIASDASLGDALRDTVLAGAWLFGVPGLVFGYIAFVGYLREGPHALAEGRAAHAGDVARTELNQADNAQQDPMQHRADPPREESR